MSLPTFEVTESKVTCRKSIALRVGMGLFGMLLGGMCVSLFFLFWPAPGSLADRSPADVLDQTAPFLLVPFLGLCVPTALFLYTAGPEDLIVDTDRRTYRFRRGFPLLASWQSGPLEDIAGLRVKTVKSNSTTQSSSATKNKSTASYQLVLDWKNTEAAPWSLGDGGVSSRRPVQMAVSRDANQVHGEARRLASRFGVPLEKTAPVWDEVRSRTRTRLVLVPVILFFTLMGLPPLLVEHALDTQGQTAKGRVTALRHVKGYSVRYTYPVGARVFHGRASVPGSTFSSLEVGGLVSVRYLPAYPHTSTVAGVRSGGDLFPALLLAGLLLVLFVASGRTPRSQQVTKPINNKSA